MLAALIERRLCVGNAVVVVNLISIPVRGIVETCRRHLSNFSLNCAFHILGLSMRSEMNPYSWMYFLLIAIACSLACADTFKAPTDIDFTGFRSAIRSALHNSNQTDTIKPLTAVSTYLDCHLPNSAIILTLANFYAVEQLALQHKALEVWNLKECLESRFVSVCLDEKCMEVCTANSIRNCYLLAIETTASEFMQNAFRFLMYLKHLLMYEALKEVQEVFFIDVDVLLFRNPFVGMLYGRKEDGSRDLNGEKPDMMWQGEFGYSSGCAGRPNGGQLYLRRTAKLSKYFETLFSLRESFLGKGQNDQDKLLEITSAANLTTCTLPFTRFTAHTMKTNAPFDKSVPVAEIVSYHTSGISGRENKVMAMGHMLKGVINAKSGNESAESLFAYDWL